MALDELEVDPTQIPVAARPPRAAGALAGLLAGAIAVGIGSLVAGIIEVRTPIDAVGTQVIDHAPVWLIDLGKRWFGTGDKAALRFGIYRDPRCRRRPARHRLDPPPVDRRGRHRRVRRVRVVCRGSACPTSRPRTFLPSLLGSLAGIVAPV